MIAMESRGENREERNLRERVRIADLKAAYKELSVLLPKSPAKTYLQILKCAGIEIKELRARLANLECKLASLEKEMHQQLKQPLYKDEQKQEQQREQAAIEATPTNVPLLQQQQQPLLPQLQEQNQKQPQDQQQKLVTMPTGIKQPRNDSDKLAGLHDYMSSQHQSNFNNSSFNKATNFQGFELQPQQPYALDMSYQQPLFPMITNQLDQRFVFQGMPSLNNEISKHQGGQQMEFDNQVAKGYGQEFLSQQQPHLMCYVGGCTGYKHFLLEHTTTSPISNCSSPSLHSPITNLSIPTSVTGSSLFPHELLPVFQMDGAPAASHD